MEAKRQRANEERETLGKQIIPWNFGTPISANEAGSGQAHLLEGPIRHKPSIKRPQPKREVELTVDRHQRSHRPRSTELTWDEFLQEHALPFSNQRIDPLNQQRAIRWTTEDIPTYTRTDGVFPKLRSNIMELICRSQQDPWWPHGIYPESILTTLVITRKFGRVYPIFDSSHWYGLTAWYKLLLCIQ
jgi:hypothetical protein